MCYVAVLHRTSTVSVETSVVSVETSTVSVETSVVSVNMSTSSVLPTSSTQRMRTFIYFLRSGYFCERRVYVETGLIAIRNMSPLFSPCSSIGKSFQHVSVR